MIDKIKYISNSPEDTMSLGRKISKSLEPGEIIGLNGNLGSGKTTFIKGILKGLNYKSDVTSPTFSLVNEYDADLKVIHIDFYREPNIKRWKDIGFEEIIYNNDIILIEWSNLIPEILPEEIKIFTFFHLDINKRKINLL